MAETRRSRLSATRPLFLLAAVGALTACGGSGTSATSSGTSAPPSRQTASTNPPTATPNSPSSAAVGSVTLSYATQGELPILSADQSLLPANQRLNFGHFDAISGTESIYTPFAAGRASTQSVGTLTSGVPSCDPKPNKQDGSQTVLPGYPMEIKKANVALSDYDQANLSYPSFFGSTQKNEVVARRKKYDLALRVAADTGHPADGPQDMRFYSLNNINLNVVSPVQVFANYMMKWFTGAFSDWTESKGQAQSSLLSATQQNHARTLIKDFFNERAHLNADVCVNRKSPTRDYTQVASYHIAFPKVTWEKSPSGDTDCMSTLVWQNMPIPKYYSKVYTQFTDQGTIADQSDDTGNDPNRYHTLFWGFTPSVTQAYLCINPAKYPIAQLVPTIAPMDMPESVLNMPPQLVRTAFVYGAAQAIRWSASTLSKVAKTIPKNSSALVGFAFAAAKAGGKYLPVVIEVLASNPELLLFTAASTNSSENPFHLLDNYHGAPDSTPMAVFYAGQLHLLTIGYLRHHGADFIKGVHQAQRTPGSSTPPAEVINGAMHNLSVNAQPIAGLPILTGDRDAMLSFVVEQTSELASTITVLVDGQVSTRIPVDASVPSYSVPLSFADAGTHSVRVVVNSSNGTLLGTGVRSVNVQTPPGDDFEATYTPSASQGVVNGTVGKAIQFKVSAGKPSGAIAQISFHHQQDGWIGTNCQANCANFSATRSFSFTSPGLYTVQSTVLTASGGGYAHSWIVSVSAAPTSAGGTAGSSGPQVNLIAPTGTKLWTWAGGSALGGSAGYYGTKGIADPSDFPPARTGAVGWHTSDGHDYLFGGQFYAGNGGDRNDLWMRDPSTGHFTWLSGSNQPNQPGSYGTRGIGSATNVPGARDMASGWVGPDGNLYLFGGNGMDANGNVDFLNDLHEFNRSTHEWIWLSGSKYTDAASQYGTQGIPSTQNTPGAREGAIIWKMPDGTIYLLGGQGIGERGIGELDDLWRYTPSSGTWAYLGGPKGINAPSSYGAKGVYDSGSWPGGRDSAAAWVGKDGMLYLFSGNFAKSATLWRYDPEIGQWAWLTGGPSSSDATAIHPGKRSQAQTWVGTDGRLMLFGGYGIGNDGSGQLNDLWALNPSDLQWSHLAGPESVDGAGSYGQLGTGTGSTKPGARQGSVGWIDSNGNLLLFGGYGYDQIGTQHAMNDLWTLRP